MRILLVEDEQNIRKLLKMNLEWENYEVVEVVDGKQAVILSREQHFDLIILDVMLPEVSGFDACEQIRLTNSEVPIIFLTARDTPQDRIFGLKKGGDDYLTKPFQIEELILRVNNLIRRSNKNVAEALETFSFGGNTVNFVTMEAQCSNGNIKLTKKEILLLKLLVERKNEVISRNQILQAVWGYDVYPSTRTIDNFILNFRKYFETDPGEPKFFMSIRSVGYKFAMN